MNRITIPAESLIELKKHIDASRNPIIKYGELDTRLRIAAMIVQHIIEQLEPITIEAT